MSAAARLGGYLAILAVVFAAAFLIGGAIVPQSAVDSWTEQAEQSTHAEMADEPRQPSTAEH